METDFDIDQDIEIMIAPKYKVIFFNDDVTTFEFVIDVLMRFFLQRLKSCRKLGSENSSYRIGSGRDFCI